MRRDPFAFEKCVRTHLLLDACTPTYAYAPATPTNAYAPAIPTYAYASSIPPINS